MRDYLSPATKYVTKVIPHPSAIRAVLIKRRAYTFIIAATLLVVFLTGFMIVRGMNAAGLQNNDAVTNDKKTTTQTTVTAAKSDDTQPAAQGAPVNSENTSSSSGSKTNVTVNNQKIDVPQNGSVTKTVQSNNGTTSVSVTSNSDGSVSNNTSTTTNLNISSSSESQTSSVNVSNSTQ